MSFWQILHLVLNQKSYKEATKHNIWKNSMKNEISAMEENETFEVVFLPTGKTPIGCG